MNIAPINAPAGPQFFAYEAQTDDGQRINGTIEAANAELAMQRLQAMRLRVMELAPASRPIAGRALRGDDFLAFNQQLAQLAAAGLPVEQGLRFMAADVRRGRLARTIEQLAAELESGTPLEQAFEKFRTRFPPLYGQIIRAGVKSGNLSGVLLSLGRHLDLVQRLRAMLWRAVSYPLLVLVSLGFLLSFLGIVVLPRFGAIYRDLHLELPWVTQALLALSRAAPALLIALLGLIIGLPLAWRLLERPGYSPYVIDSVVIPLPLIGPVLRANLTARWCDMARVGVEAGLDLPTAIELADDAAASPRLADDGRTLIEALSAGKPLTTWRMRLLPPTVPAAIQFASGQHDLPTTLGALSDMYQRQAELRMAVIPGILTPLLLLLIAMLVAFVIAGLLAPFLSLINGITGVSPRRGGR